MGENNEPRPSFSSLNTPLISHRRSSATVFDSPYSNPTSGTSTPPLQSSSVSVPFKWEQEPGKPRPEIQITTRPDPSRFLDPPPCRASITSKAQSPPSILDGPYNVGRPMFSSSRFFRESHDSFEGTTTFDGTPYLIGVGTGGGRRSRGRGLFGKLKGGKREVDGGNSGFSFSSNSSSSCDSSEESCVRRIDGRKLRRHDSFSGNSHDNRSSHIWATIYGGLKHVIHWKSSRKESAYKEGQD